MGFRQIVSEVVRFGKRWISAPLILILHQLTDKRFHDKMHKECRGREIRKGEKKEKGIPSAMCRIMRITRRRENRIFGGCSPVYFGYVIFCGKTGVIRQQRTE